MENLVNGMCFPGDLNTSDLQEKCLSSGKCWVICNNSSLTGLPFPKQWQTPHLLPLQPPPSQLPSDEAQNNSHCFVFYSVIFLHLLAQPQSSQSLISSSQRGLLMVGFLNYVLVLTTSSDGMIFRFWGHFNRQVTSSHSLLGGRKMPPVALPSTDYSVHLWDAFVTCFIYFASTHPHLPRGRGELTTLPLPSRKQFCHLRWAICFS